jgi:hypothetical protein
MGDGEMIPESEAEKRQRQERELEQMRQAIANYRGPITRIPQGKTGAEGWIRRRSPHQAKARNGDGRSG